MRRSDELDIFIDNYVYLVSGAKVDCKQAGTMNRVRTWEDKQRAS